MITLEQLKPFMIDAFYNDLSKNNLYNDLTDDVVNTIKEASGVDLSVIPVPEYFKKHIANVFMYLNASKRADTIKSETFDIIKTNYISSINYFSSQKVVEDKTYPVSNQTGLFSNNYEVR